MLWRQRRMEEEVNVLNVLPDVAEERVRQEAKWGQQNHDPFAWMVILGEEFGEACQAALHFKFTCQEQLARGCVEAEDFAKLHAYREELVQTAAVAVAAIECLDRAEWEWGGNELGGQ